MVIRADHLPYEIFEEIGSPSDLLKEQCVLEHLHVHEVIYIALSAVELQIDYAVGEVYSDTACALRNIGVVEVDLGWVVSIGLLFLRGIE